MSNVLLTNGVKFDSSSLASFIDTNNVLATMPNLPYTASEDCIVYAACSSAYYHDWKVSDVGIFRSGFQDSYASFGLCVPLLKGQSISVPGRTQMRVFGLK